MARPERKKSTFGTSHPLDRQEEAVAAPSNTKGAGEKPAIDLPKKKASFMADEETIDRIRAAWFHTPTMSGKREASFSDFLLEAALARAANREQTFNEGKEFPSVPAGKIGGGRPPKYL